MTLPRVAHAWRTVTVVSAVLLVLNAGVGLLFGLKFTEVKRWLQSHGYQAINPLGSSRVVLERLPEVLKYAVLPGFFDSDDQAVPEIAIDVKFKHYQKIRDKRSEALRIGLLLKRPDDFVPATIRIGSKVVKAKIRLKGDHTDHLRDDNKWSFRIETKGDGQVFGLRRFSIQHPRTRGFHLQKLFNETLRHLDVLVPRFEVVRVTVNGDDWGMMYLEEHFSNELLESQSRREGVIVRFDEDLLWQQRGAQNLAGRHHLWAVRSYGYMNNKIKAFRKSRIVKSERLSRQHDTAISLLRAYVEGKLAASDVFDVVTMGKFLAAAELWGSEHPVAWPNLRFYFNPIIARFEPIGHDADVGVRGRVGSLILEEPTFSRSPFTLRVLQDPEIRRVYEDTLRRLYREIVLEGSLLEDLKRLQYEELRLLRREYYFLGEFEFGELVARATFLARMVGEEIEEKVNPDEYPLIIHANIIEENSEPYLEIANAIPFPVRVDAISWVKGDEIIPFDALTSSGIELPLNLPSLAIDEHPEFRRIRFDPPADMTELQLVLDVELMDAEHRARVIANRYYGSLDRPPIPQSSPEEQLSRHPFLSLSDSGRSLLVQRGSWPVEGLIIVPEGYKLVVPAGSTLTFETDGGIISHGALMFQGTEQAPVVFRGTPAPGSTEDPTWRGLVVLNAPEPSVWTHTKILGTADFRTSKWELTGGVTFYQSDVRMDYCLLSGHRGEDALNIIRSEFTLKDVHIANTASDAFDADFSNGRVESGLFENIGTAGGGDGIDVSGSEVSVVGTRFRNVSDKALSVGERSRLTATKVTIENVGTGAASKDGSHLVIEDSSIQSSRIAGLLAYIKKPEYEPATIEAENIIFRANTIRARAQTGSTITIDGEVVPTEDLDVEELYLTMMNSQLKP